MNENCETTKRRHVAKSPLSLTGTTKLIAEVFEDYGNRMPLTINEVALIVSSRLRAEGFKAVQIHSVSPRMAELDERGLGIIRECTAADDDHLKGSLKRGKKAGSTRRQRCWVFTSWEAARPSGERLTYHELYLNERAKRTSSKA